MKKIIVLVCGLPHSGKTTFSDMLANELQAARVNADDIRDNISTDLGFSIQDRIIQASRMSHIALLAAQGRNSTTVADFVCPTKETMEAFKTKIANKAELFVVWMNTIPAEKSPYEDTSALYQAPTNPDFTVNRYRSILELAELASDLARSIRSLLGIRLYLLRYNTKHGDSDLRWRIIDVASNTEQLASSFLTNGAMVFPKNSMEYEVEKWNVAFSARAIWTDTHVDFY